MGKLVASLRTNRPALVTTDTLTARASARISRRSFVPGAAPVRVAADHFSCGRLRRGGQQRVPASASLAPRQRTDGEREHQRQGRRARGQASRRTSCTRKRVRLARTRSTACEEQRQGISLMATFLGDSRKRRDGRRLRQPPLRRGWCLRRYVSGVTPRASLNARARCRWAAKPARCATASSVIRSVAFVRRSRATSMR